MGDKKSCCCCTTRISVCNLAMSLGVVWGLAMLVTALLSMWLDIGTPFIVLFGSLYIGFEATMLGALLGLFWGFVDGFIGGALIAFFYNWFSCKCPCSYCKKNRKSCKM